MTRPAESGFDSSSRISEPPYPELALRSIRDVPPKSFPNVDVSDTTPTSNTGLTLPELESKLFRAPSATPISISRTHSNLQSKSHGHSSVGDRGSFPPKKFRSDDERCRQIIIRSFAPRVAVFASTDTDEFLKQKGFGDGIYGLLRPYGENIQGKVTVRDSVGGSKEWDDFGIRLVDSRELQHRASPQTSDTGDQGSRENVNGFFMSSGISRSVDASEERISIDQIMERYLNDEAGTLYGARHGPFKHGGRLDDSPSRYFSWFPIYLRKLLSSMSVVPYDTISHPVACVIAVSSHHPAPIEALRHLYASTCYGSDRIPDWISTEYLRYYILIHDEETGDIAKSTALFDLMKRHFGLHCHLLRLRSSQCVKTDDESTMVPPCEWSSAEEEIKSFQARDYTEDVDNYEKYVHESDATAIKSLLREMTVQSIIPFMENRVIAWNEQVVSRRRGLSGRFLSLGKRWAGLSPNKAALSGPGGTNTSNSNYDYQKGIYPLQTPEAITRQLADYAFLLRDWKLATSTYDLLRTDFGHDKAWAYHAAANEMTAIATLINLPLHDFKTKIDAVDQLLESTVYSYLTRCFMPFKVVRCLTLAMELLRDRGISAANDAAGWGGKLLELSILAPFSQALTVERIADYYVSQPYTNPHLKSGHSRLAALWNVLAFKTWFSLGKASQARLRLHEASLLYGLQKREGPEPAFPDLQILWQMLGHTQEDFQEPNSIALIDFGDDGSNFGPCVAVEREELSASACPDSSHSLTTEEFVTQGAGRPSHTTLGNALLENDDGFA